MNYLLRRRKLGLGSCRGIRDASETGLNFIRNDKQLPQDAKFAFRWGCTSNIPQGPVIVNTAAAIHAVADKATFRMACAEKELAPASWLSYHDLKKAEVLGELKWPVVVRRRTHHQGRFLHLCENIDETIRACNKYGEGNYYISEYIAKTEEYRVFVCQGRVVWVAKKTPGNPDEIAWNVAKGGRFDNVRFDEWPLRTVRVACEAFALTELDFGGVDVMVNADGKAYVLEVNSAPSQTSPYRQSCTAKAFDYIVQNGKKTIPLVNQRGGWKKFVHPAISDLALEEA